MIAGLITGLILGGALAWFFMNLRMKAFARECNERMEGLKVSAGKASAAASGFRYEVEKLRKHQQEGQDLILLFPDLIN